MVFDFNVRCNLEINERDNYDNEELFNYIDECRITLDLNDTTINEPLEVILLLIKEAKISIEKLFVSKVTEQFLSYVEHLKEKNLDEIGDYLVIASKIILIKVRAMLPPLEDESSDEEYDYTDDQEAMDFINNLAEYQLFKEASQKLKQQEMLDRFYKEPDKSTTETKVVYNDFNLDGLVKAFSSLMLRYNLNQENQKTVKEIPAEAYSEDDKIRFVSSFLKERGSCSFYELFGEHTNRLELITTFKVVLELIKLQCISVEQNGVYDDITLNFKKEWSEADGRVE